ncbi:ribosomal protein S13 [Conidiobolus coronatus NRRL 28638]|jgi:small subunit ribosomal protein S13|uniref:Ribosomal protein S13 n=1 Tax=Conidiobolus coronatus (strain ATCC 28846 / CBS 209.66 / NRRL 28638) TaxID=796925 RepID=A0A137P8K3_CONC2|nr:ribosomal protein S13 [Conidiobolus coronatus NRRL 28638]|eukprot:KXN71333.1 ribosomal protein S13 [Conidiobolus coronatus NRRL 28638]
MVHILGVNLPEQKVVRIALTYIYGIGPQTAQTICNQLSIHRECKLRDLDEVKIIQLTDILSKMTIESDLKREVKKNIQGLKNIGCYVGRRHTFGYPVHGQNTRNNAKIAKRLNIKRSYTTGTAAWFPKF